MMMLIFNNNSLLAWKVLLLSELRTVDLDQLMLPLQRVQALKLAGCTAFGLYLCDVYHVFTTLEEHHGEYDKAGKEEVDYEKYLVSLYKQVDSDKKHNEGVLVSNEAFQKKLLNLKETLQQNTDDFDSISYQILRESCNFLAGGRAALLQLAHPFISSGILQHSNLAVNGVQQRFYRTFKYMFGINFGDKKEAFAAANSIRKLHNKVYGELDENISDLFPAEYKYDASNKHALYWVFATLLESQILMHELMVRRLTVAEKDLFIKESNRTAAMFGIDHSDIPRDWASFIKYNRGMWNSKVLLVSNKARLVKDFLLEPPDPIYKPLLHSIEWSTAVKLPPPQQVGFFGKTYGFKHKLAFAILYGQLRFVYRLLPGCFRFLSAYHRMTKRNGKTYNAFQELLMRLSAFASTQLLALAMPPRRSKIDE